MAEMRKHHQWNVFSVNSFIQYALADYLREAYSYNGLATFYQEKRDHFNAVINGTSLKPLASQGTYFQLFDYSEVSDKSDLEFAKDMVTEWGIASIPLSPFFSDGSEDKLVRFCFAKTEALLDQAGELLRRV
jgi:methionine aminotransferase